MGVLRGPDLLGTGFARGGQLRVDERHLSGGLLFHLILLALTHALSGVVDGGLAIEICTLIHAEKGRQKPQLVVS